jgi:hypothetical protein
MYNASFTNSPRVTRCDGTIHLSKRHHDDGRQSVYEGLFPMRQCIHYHTPSILQIGHMYGLSGRYP